VHVDVSAYGDYTIRMYDVVGHLILEKNISTGTSFDLPLFDFKESAGMYLIQVSDSYNRITLKLIKL
jgi:hypothetical protein